jgi:hypothetical protein
MENKGKTGISFATILISPAKQPAVPQNGFGFKALFIATSLFLISSGSASNAFYICYRDFVLHCL